MGTWSGRVLQQRATAFASASKKPGKGLKQEAVTSLTQSRAMQLPTPVMAMALTWTALSKVSLLVQISRASDRTRQGTDRKTDKCKVERASLRQAAEDHKSNSYGSGLTHTLEVDHETHWWSGKHDRTFHASPWRNGLRRSMKFAEYESDRKYRPTSDLNGSASQELQSEDIPRFLTCR